MTEKPLKNSVLFEAPVITDEWVIRRQRKDAAREMDVLCASMPKVSLEEVAKWIREDREQGH